MKIYIKKYPLMLKKSGKVSFGQIQKNTIEKEMRKNFSNFLSA
jgi:hypothetical protein